MSKDICPICNSNKTKELYQADIDLDKLSFTYVKNQFSGKTFRSVRCLNCSHVFCTQIINNIHDNYTDVVDYEYLKYLPSITESSKKILLQIKKIKKTGIILDIGCATGQFLSVAKSFGYEVEGLELSNWSSQIAIDKGIKVHKKLLKDLANKTKGRYDIITLFGVIEHFEDPYKEFSYINKLLKPSGIVVVWTGDIDSLSSKLLGKNWWYWQGQHIQYFSQKSMNILSKRTGIKHLFTNTYPFVATYGLLKNSLSRYKVGGLLSAISWIFFTIKPKWTFYIPGEMLWFGQKVVNKK